MDGAAQPAVISGCRPLFPNNFALPRTSSCNVTMYAKAVHSAAGRFVNLFAITSTGGSRSARTEGQWRGHGGDL